MDAAEGEVNGRMKGIRGCLEEAPSLELPPGPWQLLPCHTIMT